jgi:hypothetical protein
MIWIQTYSGIAFDLENPTPEMVTIEDIAHALSQINRFTGHTQWPYSVAQHCMAVSEFVDAPCNLWALLHDAAEAYLGDVASPLKQLLPEYSKLEEKVERVIVDKLMCGQSVTNEIRHAVKIVDMRMLMTEAAQLLGPTPIGWGCDAKPYDIELDKLDPEFAEYCYLQRFEKLCQ